MPRLVNALKEWLELRARMREERRFHLDGAATDLRAMGMTAREAKRMARIRFGSRRNSQAGLRELGGDLKGLAYLFRANRVVASIWLQPIVLIAVVAMMFLASPSRREIVEGLLGHRLGPEEHGTVMLSVYGAGPASPGIALTELVALQSMSTVTGAEAFGPHAVLARRAADATLAAITSEAQARTGNREFYASWMARSPRVMTSPAKVIWLLIAVYGAFFLYSRTRRRVTPRWLLYAVGMGCLHAVASILAWALATQVWERASWLGFSLIVVVYLLGTAVQCFYWWHDLRHRCPVCLDRLLLSWTTGEPGRVLLRATVTESVCAQGHGVLIESHWLYDFRRESSPLVGLARN